MAINLPTMSREGVYDISDFGLKPELPEVFDASMLKAFMDCESQFYLRYILGLQGKGPEKPHFAWGRKWHEAMYVYHADFNINAALTVIPQDWPHESLPTIDEPKNRTLERMVNIMVQYAGKYGALEQAEWEVLRREQYFDIECGPDDDCPFGGCGLRWCGRMDQIKRNLENGKVYVTDYKTTSYYREAFWTDQKTGFQIPGYVWAAYHILPEYPVGAFIDLLYTLKTKEDFKRREIRLLPVHIVEWRENVKPVIERINEMYEKYSHDPEAWTKNWNECSKLWPCDYTSVHFTPDSRDTRLMILEQNYDEVRWDPSLTLD